ncbi:PREDICTED: vomeronasal type-1 receptor 4-like, partial [Chinchilla lanigera]|uniref:vomeronasal type-1 receptor 4-like n=1 Tax=Chinchilla lanigera TaxID=34839 RepID=UPI000696DE67
MFLGDKLFGFVLISEIFLGLIGNLLVFILYMFTFLINPHLKKPIDLIFTHLTLVNVLTIMFRLLPDIMSSFGLRQFLDNVGCKIFLYAYRVTRGLSICTTSLLSVFQAITISPSNSQWEWVKSKLSKWIFPLFLFFWIINMLTYIPIIETVRANRNFTAVGSVFSQAYCHVNHYGYVITASFLCMTLTRDLLFVVLMIWSSLYMVNLLYRHRQRTHHVHSLCHSSQLSPEHKATHSILLLVSCFVFFYGSNNIIMFCLFFRPKKIPGLDRINGVLSSWYPAICPFILMKNKKIIS